MEVNIIQNTSELGGINVNGAWYEVGLFSESFNEYGYAIETKIGGDPLIKSISMVSHGRVYLGFENKDPIGLEVELLIRWQVVHCLQ
jgi:hypothetical protein